MRLPELLGGLKEVKGFARSPIQAGYYCLSFYKMSGARGQRRSVTFSHIDCWHPCSITYLQFILQYLVTMDCNTIVRQIKPGKHNIPFF